MCQHTEHTAVAPPTTRRTQELQFRQGKQETGDRRFAQGITHRNIEQHLLPCPRLAWDTVKEGLKVLFITEYYRGFHHILLLRHMLLNPPLYITRLLTFRRCRHILKVFWGAEVAEQFALLFFRKFVQLIAKQMDVFFYKLPRLIYAIRFVGSTEVGISPVKVPEELHRHPTLQFSEQFLLRFGQHIKTNNGKCSIFEKVGQFFVTMRTQLLNNFSLQHA